MNRVFDGITDLLSHPDPYVVERALYSIDRLLTREKEISMRNKLKAVSKIKELRGDVKLGFLASRVMEKLEKTTNIAEETIEGGRKLPGFLKCLNTQLTMWKSFSTLERSI
ncbi:hypothetical protein [Thermococcus peptonophilus]|uniref:hypothetical protein n=1 Tax=Thermococcus peptonophilus TaxID=53952 RepID=UPI000A66E1A2